MLLVNLTTIYQGTIPTLRHTQQNAYTLAIIYLRYVLTGELDGRIAMLLTDLSNTHPFPTRPMNPNSRSKHGENKYYTNNPPAPHPYKPTRN
jgi:hypothetical protein